MGGQVNESMKTWVDGKEGGTYAAVGASVGLAVGLY